MGITVFFFFFVLEIIFLSATSAMSEIVDILEVALTTQIEEDKRRIPDITPSPLSYQLYTIISWHERSRLKWQIRIFKHLKKLSALILVSVSIGVSIGIILAALSTTPLSL